MVETRPISLWLLGVVIVVLAFGAGMWLSAHRLESTDVRIDGLLWPDPPAVATFNLIDDAGDPFTLDALRGRWTLLFFGFTHCPDVCPTTLEALARAEEILADNPRYRERGQVVFVSVDPERDSGDKLAAYVHYFSPHFIGVTGGEAELRELTRSVGALFMKVEHGEDYSVDHSAGVFFIDPQARLVSVLTPPVSATAIAARFDAVSAFVETRQ